MIFILFSLEAQRWKDSWMEKKVEHCINNVMPLLNSYSFIIQKRIIMRLQTHFNFFHAEGKKTAQYKIVHLHSQDYFVLANKYSMKAFCNEGFL